MTDRIVRVGMGRSAQSVACLKVRASVRLVEARLHRPAGERQLHRALVRLIECRELLARQRELRTQADKHASTWASKHMGKQTSKHIRQASKESGMPAHKTIGRRGGGGGGVVRFALTLKPFASSSLSLTGTEGASGSGGQSRAAQPAGSPLLTAARYSSRHSKGHLSVSALL